MKYHTLFFPKLGKMSQNVSSASVVIGALRVKTLHAGLFCTIFDSVCRFFFKLTSSKSLSVTAQSILDTNHAQRSVGSDLGTNCFQKVSTEEKGRN